MFYLQGTTVSDNDNLDDLCQNLDDLSLDNLDLIEKKISLTLKLEDYLRKGHIELAKARYIRGKESIGALQIPSEDVEIRSLFNLDVDYLKEDSHDIPHFEINLKKSNKTEDELPNPIKWFGVLVPQSLRAAQKHFQEAVYAAVEIANAQAQLNHKSLELVALRKKKLDTKS